VVNSRRDVIDWGRLGACFGSGASEYHLDPDDPLEVAVRAAVTWDGIGIDELTPAWGGLLEQVGDDEEAFLDLFQPLSVVPAGGSWLQWARYVAGILSRVVVSGSPEFPNSGPTGWGQPAPTPVTAFFNQRVAHRAVIETLGSHAAAVRQWCTDPMAPPRLQLYSAAAAPVGEVRTPEHPPGTRSTRVAITGCAVLVGRSSSTGEPKILQAYPEPSFPGCDARDRWPHLPAVFGGYFGQRYPSLDANTWAAERALNEQLSEPARARLGDQLADLLEVDDETLRGAIQELGSYVVPAQPRRWVMGLRRRMLDVEWARPVQNDRPARFPAVPAPPIKEIRR
jgi:hypothetical protein